MADPPEILEINIEDFHNPYLVKNYILSRDTTEYINLNLLDSDERYIVTQLLRIKDMKPIIRIFDRKMTLCSYGMGDIQYADYLTQGDYLFSLHNNHIFIKS